MKFYDRTQEIARLREIDEVSQEVSQFTVITGRRRIGKTELVKKAYDDREMLYFFVARKAESDLCTTFMEEIRNKLDVPMPDMKVHSFASVFKFVMEIACKNHLILFIDEFQDFYRINSSIFSEMQNIWDEYKSKARINLIVGGSVNTLLNKIFRDKKEPLYGRQTDTIKVRPFLPSVLKEILKDHYPEFKAEDLLGLYVLTGGVAKYVELFIDHKQYSLNKMLKAVFSPDSFFLTEGKSMLIEEFGRDYGTYFSILSLIAQGYNFRADIEDALGGIELSGYLRKLIEDYELIEKHQPLYETSINKNVRYAITDHFFRFWFRFIYKYQHIIEAGGIDKLLQIVVRDYPTFSGLSLESYFKDCMKESGQYTRIGYWHDRRGENEIDIIAEDEFEKQLKIFEVKRQAKNLDINILKDKADVFVRTVGRYKGYDISCGGLSMEDM